MNNVVKLQKEPFDVSAEIDRLEKLSNQDGALGIFIGKVRADGSMLALNLEHYPSMAQNVLEKLCQAAQERFSLSGCTVIHRYGRLKVGEKIVFVAATSAHRAQSLQAVSYLIDKLKTDVPFWKKIEYKDGKQSWVEQKASDKQQSASWS